MKNETKKALNLIRDVRNDPLVQKRLKKILKARTATVGQAANLVTNEEPNNNDAVAAPPVVPAAAAVPVDGQPEAAPRLTEQRRQTRSSQDLR